MNLLTGLPSLQTAAQGEQLPELASFLSSFSVLPDIALNTYRCLIRLLFVLEQCCTTELSEITATICNRCCPIQEPLAICGSSKCSYCVIEESRFQFHLIKCRSPYVTSGYQIRPQDFPFPFQQEPQLPLLKWVPHSLTKWGLDVFNVPNGITLQKHREGSMGWNGNLAVDQMTQRASSENKPNHTLRCGCHPCLLLKCTTHPGPTETQKQKVHCLLWLSSSRMVWRKLHRACNTRRSTQEAVLSPSRCFPITSDLSEYFSYPPFCSPLKQKQHKRESKKQTERVGTRERERVWKVRFKPNLQGRDSKHCLILNTVIWHTVFSWFQQ